MRDVLIIGAGAAGLAAAAKLRAAGRDVIIVDARDRIGGRVLTISDSKSPVPIELGAEFIHGTPTETFDIVAKKSLAFYEIEDEHWHLHRNGELRQADFWSRIERVMDKLDEVDRDRDQSFDEFIQQHRQQIDDDEAIALARAYVEGFDAADAKRASVVGIRESEKAGAKINADRSFRVTNGYLAVLESLRGDVPIQLNSIVHKIEWSRRHVLCRLRDKDGNDLPPIEARQMIITLPLGVLQLRDGIGAVQFDPEISSTRAAADALAMGAVTKVVIEFRRAFWEDEIIPSIPKQKSPLKNMSFMHGPNLPLPTWWTMLPMRAPILAGWSGGPKAAALSGVSEEKLREVAVYSLSRLLDLSADKVAARIEVVHHHDWQSDPFARGAYSYVPVNGINAVRALARSIDDTLFFAGEATYSQGLGGTVAAAIATGYRAAAEILGA